MQIGFNNDIQHRGKTFHIQTEDRGLPAAQIETQIFHAGAILDTTVISYQRILDSEPDEEARTVKIRTMMQAAHRNLYKKMVAGEYDAMVGLERTSGPATIEVEDFAPGQDRVPASALELERNPEAFAIAHEMGESVDISKLKEHLGGLPDGDSGVEEEASPTMVVTPEQIQAAPPIVAPPAVASVEQLSKKLSADSGMLRRPSTGTAIPSLSPVELPKTGVRAWSGCVTPKEDLSLVPLVEAFLAR